MANASFQRNIGSLADGQTMSITWLLTTADPTGDYCEFPEWDMATWQFGQTGDVLGGAVGAALGANTTATADFQTLTNKAGFAAATFAAFGIKSTIENTRYLRPSLTTPGAGASIRVTLFLRRSASIN